MHTQELEEITALSREYGQGHNWVIGGGGNTSIKTTDHMWIKASGTTLGEINPEQFVKMDRSRLDAIWEAVYPENRDEREQQALADLMAARVPGEEAKRPSVETMMHALFPQRIVFHTHPTALNGLTCSREGQEQTARLFGDHALWIPTVNPGYILARLIFDLVQQWRAAHDGASPRMLVMQNHGLVVAGETPEEIRSLHREIMDTLDPVLSTRPEVDPVDWNPAHLEEVRDAVEHAVADHRASHGDALNPPVSITFTTPELIPRMVDAGAFAPLTGALSPDHIVYSGFKPCFVPPAPRAAVRAAILTEVHEFCHNEEECPKVVVVGGYGAVAVGTTEKKARLAALLFLDALKVARFAENFGGVQPMPPDQVEFIRNWEVEKFRENVSTT